MQEILANLYRAVDHYSRACQVNCRVIDITGNMLHAVGTDCTDEISSESGATEIDGSQAGEMDIDQNCWAVPFHITPECCGQIICQMPSTGVAASIFSNPHRQSACQSILEKILKTLTFRYQLPQAAVSLASEAQPKTPEAESSSKGSVVTDSVDALAIESRLIRAINSGDTRGALRELDQILSHHVSTTGSWQQTSARLIELLVLISRAAIQGGIKPTEVLKLNPVLFRQLPALRSPDEIRRWFEELVTNLSDQIHGLQSKQYSDSIQKAIHFIETNHQSRLSLQETADRVYLSPAYFSRLFKMETGINFCEYLTLVRIEKAKYQLLTTQVSLKDLADQLGFDGQSYFAKVFKKTTGLTPGRFRESSGRSRPLAAS